MERQIASPTWISRGFVVFLLLSFAEGVMAATGYADRVSALTELMPPKSGATYTERSYRSPLAAELTVKEAQGALDFHATVRNQGAFAWFVPTHDYFLGGSFRIYDRKGAMVAAYPVYEEAGRLKLGDDMFGELKPGQSVGIDARVTLSQVLERVEGGEFVIQFANSAVPPGLEASFMNERKELISIVLSSQRIRARCAKEGGGYRCSFSPEK
ncbi:hypothetical protein FE772_03055 [Lysobacter enzymogenes]|nr:hypothetical protein [Lysobacter enzymogenes]QCW24800.1 hypothetical protein FE772_03055 [Lysobacter enzymogenes]